MAGDTAKTYLLQVLKRALLSIAVLDFLQALWLASVTSPPLNGIVAHSSMILHVEWELWQQFPYATLFHRVRTIHWHRPVCTEEENSKKPKI